MFAILATRVTLLNISHYRLLNRLGAGASAEVYLAEDLNLRRKVALKLLHRKLTANSEQVKRFKQEAEWTSMLNHPNVLTIFETGIEDGTYYIATEYVEGETLRQTLTHPIDLMRILDITSGVASALVAAHELWLIHRDIKPENIMIRKDGYVKVLDFGVAKLTQSLSAGLTLPHMVIGTLEYLSPEQIEGEAVDPRTDLYALGVVLYEMLVGQTPFTADSIIDIINNVRTREPRLENVRLEGVPGPIAAWAIPELDRIIRKLLEKNPELRFQSGNELLKEIGELKQELQFQKRAIQQT